MNQLTSDRYVENIQRLALGLEILDAASGLRVASPLSVAFDGVPLALPGYREPKEMGRERIDDVLLRVDRHSSCLFAVVYSKGLYRKGKKETVDLRFLSADRRFVPRRLTIPLSDPAVIEAADTPDILAGDPALLGANRIRSLRLFPGAAYGVGHNTTGLRGRVRSSADNTPIRWVRVEARMPRAQDGTPGELVSRAQGDDRGEFLLLISSVASPVGPLPAGMKIPLEVTAFRATTAPSVTAFVKQNDPLWDLPLEVVTGTGPSDGVTLGEQLPPTYTTSSAQTISFELGQIMTSEISPFIF